MSLTALPFTWLITKRNNFLVCAHGNKIETNETKQNRRNFSFIFSNSFTFSFFFYFTFSGERNVYENKMVDVNLHSTKGSNKESEKN